MKFKIPKISKILTQVQIGVAVGRLAMGGKHGKIFDRIENGVEIANQAKVVADMVKQITKK